MKDNKKNNLVDASNSLVNFARESSKRELAKKAIKITREESDRKFRKKLKSLEQSSEAVVRSMEEVDEETIKMLDDWSDVTKEVIELQKEMVKGFEKRRKHRVRVAIGLFIGVVVVLVASAAGMFWSF